MRVYNLKSHLNNRLRDPLNGITMRMDLHISVFNQGLSVLVPKNGIMVVHFLESTFEFSQLLYNMPTHLVESDVGREFLFTRFAWAIFRTCFRSRYKTQIEAKPKNKRMVAEASSSSENKDGTYAGDASTHKNNKKQKTDHEVEFIHDPKFKEVC